MFTYSSKSLLTSSSHINMMCHKLKNNFSAENYKQENIEERTQFLEG